MPDDPFTADPAALAAALTEAVDGIVWTAARGAPGIAVVSLHSEHILGYTPAEWRRDASFWRDRVHPEDRSAAIDWWRAVGEPATLAGMDYRFRRADGTHVWIRHQVFPPQESAAQGGLLRGLMRDVSAQYEDRHALTARANLFEAIFRHAPDPMVIVDVDRRIQAVNPALERVFGYRGEELAGASSAVLYADPEEWKRLGRVRFNVDNHDDDTAQREPGIDRALNARFRRKNGEVFPVEAYGCTIRETGGNALGFLGVLHDASRWERVSNELRASETRFRDFAGAASDWFWEMDAQLRFSYFSDRFREITGVHPERLLGRTREETGIPGVDEAGWKAHLAALHAHRAFRDFVHPRVKPDGSTVWLSISGVPKFDRDGTFLGYRGTGSDITLQVQMQRELRESETRFRQFAEMSADYFWETDEQMRLTRIYGDLHASWGLDPEAVIGRSRLDLVLPCLDPSRATEHARALAQHQPFQDLEIRPCHADGKPRVVHSSGIALHADNGAFLGYRGASRDVTAQRRMADELAHQAAHDALTGLVNRREFEDRLERALRGPEGSGANHCLCYLDLDQFKLVNDTCGHTAGDELLRQVSAILGEHLRAGDTLARLGGDEFGILLEHCALSGARMVAENLRKAVEAFRFHWEKKIFTVGVSIGVVPLGIGEDSVAHAMSAADSACYIAKENGRNRTHVADGTDVQVSRRNTEMQWVERVTRAIEQDRLELWHQPIVSVTGAPEGERHFEILVRMRTEDGEVIAPGVFLPAAERYGLASRIDRWVLEHTLEWFDSDSRPDDPISLVSVNLSGQSLCEESFLEFASAAIANARMHARQLCFEITETTAIQNLAFASRFIRAMRALGCRFALDDFGSGVSSFAYLKTLEVDYLKLDGMFVKDIDHDPVSLAMVRSINEVGHVMGKRTIAEFVESDAVLEKLRTIGVDFAQGFGIGYPCPLPSEARKGNAQDGAPVVTPFRRPRSRKH